VSGRPFTREAGLGEWSPFYKGSWGLGDQGIVYKIVPPPRTTSSS
jgi:hypothetical protein